MNKLLIGCLASFFLLFLSCQEEDFDIKNQNLNYKVEQKSFKELMSESAFKTSVNKLSKGKTSKTGTYGKSEIEEQYNFTIYQELPVNVTETEKVIAYNIAIKSDSVNNTNSFENLVINTDKITNETEIHIVKYNLLSEITTSEHGTPDFDSTIETTPIVTNRNGACCVNLPVLMCSYQHEHVAGPNCQNQNNLYFVTLTACGECGSAGANTNVSGTASTSTTNTTSTTSGGGSNPVIISTPVVPIKPTPDQIVANFVALQLNQEQQQWWNDNLDSEAVINLSIFIVKNYPMTNENSEFVKQMIDYGVQNNNSQESSQEIKNILDIIDDGKINGNSVLVAPTVPITDMASYLSCFNTSQDATITIYADQPKTGTHNLISASESVGHAFISIKQGSTIKTLGFYPQSSIGSIIPNSLTPTAGDFLSTPGIFGNDEGHSYDVSLSTTLNAVGLTNVINGFISVANNSPQYNLNYFNCTDVAISVFESQTNINIPSCQSPRPWIGQTPGTLGEVLRNLPSGGIRNSIGGNAPSNNCN